ncbi:hypothetical protein SELMODRAFT_418208 [Selaginella moellendorffii]|uniref:SAM-dependent MTase DRM-type domain-containing protein n=1 Tax=Selaginella moellendorffii TaxID=88036 RepID=D8S507_SELML|nr:hypothetical protein SELMODRAFT_418208 [Selaginella moellendorffii]
MLVECGSSPESEDEYDDSLSFSFDVEDGYKADDTAQRDPSIQQKRAVGDEISGIRFKDPRNAGANAQDSAIADYIFSQHPDLLRAESKKSRDLSPVIQVLLLPEKLLHGLPPATKSKPPSARAASSSILSRDSSATSPKTICVPRCLVLCHHRVGFDAPEELDWNTELQRHLDAADPREEREDPDTSWEEVRQHREMQCHHMDLHGVPESFDPLSRGLAGARVPDVEALHYFQLLDFERRQDPPGCARRGNDAKLEDVVEHIFAKDHGLKKNQTLQGSTENDTFFANFHDLEDNFDGFLPEQRNQGDGAANEIKNAAIFQSPSTVLLLREHSVHASRELGGHFLELVNSKWFCAASRQRGYVHNLPALPPGPMTIQELVPGMENVRPPWDKRVKLNCITTSSDRAAHVQASAEAFYNDDDVDPH